MTITLNPLQHCIAATTLLVIVLIGVAVCAIAPAWNTYHDNAERILKAREHIVRYRQLSEQQSQLEKQIRRFEQQTKANKRKFVPGTAPAVAAAAIQQRVRELLEGTDGRLTSTQTLKIDNTEAFPRVAIKAEVNAPIETLSTLFYRLETGEPYLFVDELSIQSKGAARRRRANRAAEADLALDAQFALSGYVSGFE